LTKAAGDLRGRPARVLYCRAHDFGGN
jgi:hypothetical protein